MTEKEAYYAINESFTEGGKQALSYKADDVSTMERAVRSYFPDDVCDVMVDIVNCIVIVSVKLEITYE